MSKVKNGTDNNLKNVFLQLNQKPVAFFPIYAKITGNVKRGLFLSQLMYWYAACNGREFYKTDAEIGAETCLTKNEIRAVKKYFKDECPQFIKITVKSQPAKTYYNINYSGLVELMNLVSLKSLNKDSENHETKFSENHYTTSESTTESTTETNTDNESTTENETFSSKKEETKEEMPDPQPEPLNNPINKKESYQAFFARRFCEYYRAIHKTDIDYQIKPRDRAELKKIRELIIEIYVKNTGRQAEEGVIKDSYEHLLLKASKIDWIAKNWRVVNLYSQFYTIIQSKTKQEKQAEVFTDFYKRKYAKNERAI